MNSLERVSDNAMKKLAVESKKAMAASGRAGSNTDDVDPSLMQVNQLWYKMPPNLSLVTKRTKLKCQFLQTGYSNAQITTMTSIFNNGETMVNAKTSYLFIRCGWRDADDVQCLLGEGNIMSLFFDPTFTTATGTEVCREINKGLLSSIKGKNQFSQQYLSTIGTNQGFSDQSSLDTWDNKGSMAGTVAPFGNYRYGNTGLDATKIGGQGLVDLHVQTGEALPTFIIPMNEVLGCFDPAMNVLLPSQLLAGGRFDIRMKNVKETVTFAGDDSMTTGVFTWDKVNNFLVEDIFWQLDTFQLNDSALRKLNEVSASKNGLTVFFNTWDHTEFPSPSNGIECQVQQAKSRVSESFCIVRRTSATNDYFSNGLSAEASIDRKNASTLILQNNLTAQQQVNSYQVQLGALFFPQQPLTNIYEMIENAYYMWGKSQMNINDNNSVDRQQFFGANGSKAPTDVATRATAGWSQNWGSATYGATLERSSLLGLSGLPISNARLLRHKFNFNYLPADGQGRIINIFTKYTKVLKVFLQNRVIARE
jgi:hypothetical protein